MKIAVGSDHRGFAVKRRVIQYLDSRGFETIDEGTDEEKAVDYPDIALKVGSRVTSGQAEYGILICGTGIGMSIAANKIKGVRAALCCSDFMAERARLHNDANILCLGSEIMEDVSGIVNTFLSCPFEGGRHQKRVDKITAIEGMS